MKIHHHLSNGCSFSTKKAFLSCHQKLGELLQLNPTVNLAKGGRGNDRCVTTTMHWFLKNPERMKDTFVSIGWSSSHRWDFVTGPTKEGMKGIKGEIAKFSYQWATWRLWEEEWIARDKDVDIDMSSAMRMYTNILTLQNFFKLHNIPYLMYWALTNDLPEEGDLKLLKDAVDKKHFFNFETSEHVKENIKIYNSMNSQYHRSTETVEVPNKDYVQSHFEYVAQQGLRKSYNDAHPNKLGHHKWAYLLKNFVDENNIIPD